MLQERMVDIGGYKLRLARAGRRGPAVILEAGATTPLESWSTVQEEIGKFARVFSYDRAGLGKSEPGRQPRRIDMMAEELHALLRKARVRPPYILVGHSLGGLIVRFYAATYPAEVAGLVLVDATHEDYFLTFRKRHPASWAMYQKFMEPVIPTWPKTAQEEWQAIEEDCDLARQVTRWPKAPAAVLTSVRVDPNYVQAGMTAEVMQMNLELQRSYLKHLPGALHIVTDKSSHFIQTDEPNLVIDAVRHVVEAVSKKRL